MSSKSRMYKQLYFHLILLLQFNENENITTAQNGWMSQTSLSEWKWTWNIPLTQCQKPVIQFMIIVDVYLREKSIESKEVAAVNFNIVTAFAW